MSIEFLQTKRVTITWGKRREISNAYRHRTVPSVRRRQRRTIRRRLLRREAYKTHISVHMDFHMSSEDFFDRGLYGKFNYIYIVFYYCNIE